MGKFVAGKTRVRARGEQIKRTLGELREDESMRGASPSAKRAIYEQALNATQMNRAERLSPESVTTERAIERLRGETYEALRLMPDYRRLKEPDKKAVRKLVDDELKRHRAEVEHTRKGPYGETKVAEKAAMRPDWTPADLARAALEARP